MKTQNKPDVICIMVDQMGAKWLEAAMNGICDLRLHDLVMEYPWRETLRNGEFRYSVTPGRDDGEELFDLTNDPGELVNVVDDPGYQETRRELMKKMMHRVMLQEFPLPPRDLLVFGAH